MVELLVQTLDRRERYLLEMALRCAEMNTPVMGGMEEREYRDLRKRIEAAYSVDLFFQKR